MKLHGLIIGMLMILGVMLSSCDKEELPTKTPCDFNSENITIEPICSFNPKTATTVPFPVRVLYNGLPIGHPEYVFSWNIDPDFGGSAISVTFEQLSLVVTVTEASTDCQASATLSKEYWD